MSEASHWVGLSSEYTQTTGPSFGGLGTVGLVTIILISVLLIVTVVWLIKGTKKRD